MRRDQWTTWRPMEAAPKEPICVVAPRAGIAQTGAFGPDLALLCWDRDRPALIRAAWYTWDGTEGEWRDLDFGHAVDVRILAWAPLPSPEELVAMVGPERDEG
jgi:hypothetical protein